MLTNAEKRRKLSVEIGNLRAREKEIRESLPEELSCCAPECFEDADWVRSTQFAGDHPYCDTHAKQEKDFGQEDSSSFFWQTTSEFLEMSERRQKEEHEDADKLLQQIFRRN